MPRGRTVNRPATVDVRPPLSATRAVKAAVPAVVGEPVTVQSVFNVSAAGRAPPTDVHVSGGKPPRIVHAPAYGAPTAAGPGAQLAVSGPCLTTRRSHISARPCRASVT